MPSNQTPLGALPARFRRERLLVVGCGDVGMRVVRQLQKSMRIIALTSSASRLVALRAAGVTPLMGNLDQPPTLRRLAGVATRVIHLAPPPSVGWEDSRTRALLRALRLRSLPHTLVYGSTSGVYGDCQGDWVAETRPLRADTPRALRRVDAESHVRFLGRSGRARVSVLRIPGIYALDREGGTPQERLRKGTPVLQPQDDVYTNHIQADDLARACIAAMWRAGPQRVFNVNDDTTLKMGDYMDLAADLFGLPHPPRIPRAEAHLHLPAMMLSFMGESRRLCNSRMKTELKFALRYPTVRQGLLGLGG